MIWKPHVTVAAIIEQNQRFLLVEERVEANVVFNQPAGHLDEGEDLIAAVKREVQEETAWQFEPEAVIAVQLWRRTPQHPCFMRFCFTGTAHSHNPEQALDDGIIATHWLSRDDIAAKHTALRSPLVLLGVDEYLKGQRYPLSLLQAFLDLNDHA